VASKQRQKRRQKANPVVYQHPDLFVGESPVRVAIDDLSYDQLKKLPRANFTDEEWEELSSDLQEDIYQADGASQARIEEVAHVIRNNLLNFVQFDLEFAMSEAESGVDEQLANTDAMLEKSKRSGDYDRLREQFGENWQQGDEFEEAFEEAMKEVLSDWNMFEFGMERYEEHYGYRSKSQLIYVPVYSWIYIEWDNELDKETIDGIFRDEVERMFDEELESGYDDLLSADEVFESLKSGWKKEKHPTGVGWVISMDPLNKHIDAVAAVYGELKEDDALAEIEDLISEYEPEEDEEEDEEWTATPPEERVVYRFDDGFYVQRLTPGELAEEGKAMRMCVGREDMGYAAALRKGEIQILSLRTPGGRPKFTFEVDMDGGKIKGISQIKGKANRLPGFDLGKAESRVPGRGQPSGKMKIDEVAKIFEFVTHLGIQPRSVYDLGPAIIHIRRHRHVSPSAQKEMKRLGVVSLGADMYGETQYEQINELMDLLGAPVRDNPMRQPGRGKYPRTFDMPYRRSR
jgi:hypothetical protein